MSLPCEFVGSGTWPSSDHHSELSLHDLLSALALETLEATWQFLRVRGRDRTARLEKRISVACHPNTIRHLLRRTRHHVCLLRPGCTGSRSLALRSRCLRASLADGLPRLRLSCRNRRGPPSNLALVESDRANEHDIWDHIDAPAAGRLLFHAGGTPPTCFYNSDSRPGYGKSDEEQPNRVKRGWPNLESVRDASE